MYKVTCGHLKVIHLAVFQTNMKHKLHSVKQNMYLLQV